MNQDKVRFIETVNQILQQFELARRDPRFGDEAISDYRLSESQAHDLKEFLLLNNEKPLLLRSSTIAQIRDLVVLFSLIGLLGPKRPIVLVFPQPETLLQIYTQGVANWYQLLGIQTRFAFGADTDGTDLPIADVIITTEGFINLLEHVSNASESMRQLLQLIPIVEIQKMGIGVGRKFIQLESN